MADYLNESIEYNFMDNYMQTRDEKKVKISDYGFTILQIETMMVCNMDCKFCAYHVIRSKGTKLSSEKVHEIINAVDVNDDKLEYICFSQYGEPLLDKRIYDFIEYAKKRNFKTLLVTNGLLFKFKNIRESLIAAEPDLIKLSLHTLNEKTFSKSRGVNCSFEQYKKWLFEYLKDAVDKNSRSLITLDVACNFLTARDVIKRSIMGLERGDPSVPNSIADIKEDFVGFLKDLHNYDSCFGFDDAKTRRYLETVSDDYLAQEALPIAKNIFIKVKHFVFGRRISKFYPVIKSDACGTRILSVLANGSVVPCCLAYDDILSLGNINQATLKQIIEQKKKMIGIIKRGGDVPLVCKKCKGAPSRRGAALINLLNAKKYSYQGTRS